MSIQSEADWKGLREAGRVTTLTLKALQSHVERGVSTAELDAVAAEIFARHGALSAPALIYGFPGTVLISINDEVVHGVPGSRRLAPGDVVKLDVTVEKDGYIADVARTVIVGGGTGAAHRLIDCAQAAFRAALEVAYSGNRVSEIGRAIEREVHKRGFHGDSRFDRARCGPHDSRAALGTQSLRSAAARHVDGGSGSDDRAAGQRRLRAYAH